MDIGTIAGSAVIAAIIAAITSLRVTSRNIKIENITKERTKWREKIRRLAVQVHIAANDDGTDRSIRLDRLALELKLSLNPEHKEDVELRKLVRRLMAVDANAVDPLLKEFGDRLALLLKHDWERAKNEASPFPEQEELTP